MRSIYAAMVAGLRHGLRRGFGAFLCLALTAHAGMTTDVAMPRVVSSGWDVVYNATVGAAPSTGGIGSRSYSVAGDVWGDVLQTEKGWLTRSGSFTRAAPAVEVAVTRRVTASAVATAAGRLLPVVGTAMVGYDIWQALRCKYEAGAIQCDPGFDAQLPPVMEATWSIGGSYLRKTPYETCNAFAAAMDPSCMSMTYYPERFGCRATCTSGYTKEWPVEPSCPEGYKVSASGTTYSCVVSDPSKAAGKTCADGSTPSEFDGRCPSGKYQPKDPGAAGDYFGQNAPKVPGSADKLPGMMKQAEQNGVGVPAGAPSVTGPRSQKGEPVTTSQTGPNGTTTVTVTPTYNYTYNTTNEGARVTYTVTNNTTNTVTNNAGETVTTESSDTQPETKDDRSECEKNPDTVGCMKVGEVADESVEKITKDVAVTAEDVNLPAACPAPIVAGKYTLTFDSACGFATGVRPFVIAAAALMAALIVLRSIQGA